ncbi:hypothetical protein GC207_02145 [bacterium]|nr:hypothetical protein [bacterium]
MRRSVRGYTLVEVMVVMPIALLCLTVLLSVASFASRSFHALANYSDISSKNRLAENTMVRELRQAIRVASFTTNSLVLIDGSGTAVTYTFDAGNKTLTRERNGTTTTLLTHCDEFQFSLGERNPVGGTYDVYPSASAATAKVIDISWRCSRDLLGVMRNSESVQTARIVIRKQDI